MKRVTGYQTSDGDYHKDEATAKRHADERYGRAMLTLSHEMVKHADKYHTMSNFIDKNLYRFEELIKLKADIEVEPDPPEEDEP